VGKIGESDVMNVNILTFMKVELGKTLEVINRLHEIPEVR